MMNKQDKMEISEILSMVSSYEGISLSKLIIGLVTTIFKNDNATSNVKNI